MSDESDDERDDDDQRDDDQRDDDESDAEASSAKPSDEALLAAWQERDDKRAANLLLTRHLPSLRRYFRNKVSSHTDEEELLAQTLKALVEAIPDFRRESSFRTFLFKLARNKLHDHFRARSRKRDVVDIEELSVADLSPGPSTIRSRHRRETLLLGGLRAVSIGDQELLELRYWEKLTVPQIVEILGVDEAAVKSRLRRAKERLRKAMERLAESDEELENVRTGEIDRWADEVRRKHLAGRRSAGSGEEDGDGEGGDGEDEDER